MDGFQKQSLDLVITGGHCVPDNSEPSKSEGRGDNRDVEPVQIGSELK